jgi:SH3-like domain-containing protein
MRYTVKHSALFVGIALVGLPLILLPEVASAEILSVKGTSANFREKPHEAAKIKFSADKFYPVEVVERKAGWAKVKDFEGDEAWVAERMLQKQPSVVVAVDRANIRESAETASDVVFKAEKGEVFKIEERKGQWMKVVDAKGDGGWIRNDMTWGSELEKVDEKKTDKGEKSDTKVDAKETKGAQKAKAGEEEKSVDVKVDDKEVTIKVPTLSEPETLQMLCKAYLDDAPKSTPVKVAAKPEKASEKAKPADKKADKAKPKPAAKPAAKPKK